MSAQAGSQTIGDNEVGETKRRIARVARMTLLIVGALAAFIGSLPMSGQQRVLQVHELLGDVAILSLWTLAAVAARSGVSKGKVVLAALWGLAALSLAGAQKLPYGANLHAATQVLHVASSIGVVIGGLLLARAVLKRKPSASAPGTIAEAAAKSPA